MNVNSQGELQHLLNRREAIRCAGALLGGVVLSGGSGLLAMLESPRAAASAAPADFTAEQMAFLDEIAETILPATKTPGAKAAQTGAFMALMVADTYSPAEQRVFRNGMLQLESAMRQEYGVSFMDAAPEQRLGLLTRLDHDAKRVMDARKPVPPGEAAEPAHYFRMMKELAVLGFFTSEIGCTQVQHYVEAPGRFDPCVPYTPGDPAWAPHA